MKTLVYTDGASPRVNYIFNTVLNAVGLQTVNFTTDKEFYQNSSSVKINYSSTELSVNEIWIKPVSLLFEKDIREQGIICFNWKSLKAFYKTEGTLPFDLFAAAFYLISRYEEYLPHKVDMYGRYAHENSIAYMQGFLHQPLVNLWISELREVILQKYPQAQLSAPTFKFTPTYDIDIAWSYKHKGFVRNVGGLFKSVMKGDISTVKERMSVLANNQKDPFDSFQWMNELHGKHSLKPIYFFLLAEKNRGYDKNILPRKTAFQQLVREHASRYEVAIHPSWQSGDDEKVISKEIKVLESITNNTVTKSRQHYIRMTLPDTYQKLIRAGIKEDYSMGYGSINGFRASYCLPYKWYDLQNEKETDLTIFPFCYMDANSYYEQHLSAEEALQEMQHYFNIIKKVNGHLITIWHNHFLGTDPMFKGWKEVYRSMIENLDF